MTPWQRWVQKPQTTFLRKLSFQIHLWVGIAIGLYIVMLSVTGSALVFRRELDAAFRPRSIPFDKSQPVLSKEQLAEAASRLYPGFTVDRVGDPQRRTALVRVLMRSGGQTIQRDFNVHTGEDLGDPYSWQVVAIIDLAELHDDLLLQDKGRGRFWNGVGSILVTLLCLTGVVLWWRGLKAWKKGLRFSSRSPWTTLNFDLHSALGFWSFAIVLLWAVSGIYLSFPEPFGWAVDWIWPLEQYNGERPGDVMLLWLTRLHFGRWSSHALKVVWVVTGLIPAAMFVTGFIMWWQRKVVPARQPAAERREFLKTSAVAGAGVVAGGMSLGAVSDAVAQAARAVSTRKPIRIILGGYAPADNGFSLALKRIGDRLTARFKGEVDVKYVYNILDLGYRGEDIMWLVESGVLTLGYQSSSYLTERVPDLGIADLPFLFPDTSSARAAMDGRLGQILASRIEAGMNFRICGWFENGFRHISNRVRPVHVPADLKGMTIRVLPSQVQARTFELLGAVPKVMDLSEAITAVKAGTLDAQENPFLNTVTYGIHQFHKFHSATSHFYVSRPIFVHRPSFDGWPRELQGEMRAAIKDAVANQRIVHVGEEEQSAATIRKAGGEIVELTPEQHKAFVDAVRPIYGEARKQYGRELLALVNLV